MFPTYENGILGLIPREEWLNVGFNVTRQNDPIDGLFGDEKTTNISARWQSIASEYQIPVMAQFHAFDVEAQTTFRPPVDNHYIEKGLIKVKINQSERMRILSRSGVREESPEMYDYILGDGARLAEQVFTRTKVAKNEVLATGKLTIKENNLDLTVDYGVPTAQTQFVFDLDPTADLGSQLENIIQAAKDVGVVLNGMITSSANIKKMRANAGLQRDINGNVGIGSLVRSNSFEAFMSEEYGINRIIVNDLTYAVPNGMDAQGRPKVKQVRYYPSNKITFFSTNLGGRLGTGLWGDPPEIEAARFGHQATGNGGISPYVYVDQYMEHDPTVLWTRASGLFIPVLYNPNSLFVATVADNFLDKLTVAPEDGDTTIFGHTVSDLQTNVSVSGNAITGTLKYVDSGALAHDWGAGNFLALKFSNTDSKATSVKVGLEPSASGMGLVELINDPDQNGVFKITNKNVQAFKVIVSNGEHETVQTYDLSGLTLLDS